MTHCHTYMETLRARGYRITPQREMIIDEIVHHPSHLTADEVYNLIQSRSRAINRATVYRTLDLLVEEGLVTRSDFGQGETVYAVDKHGPHLHLVCRRCGKVTAAEHTFVEPLEERLRESYGFDPDFNHLAIFGLCSQCRKGDVEP